MAEPIEQPVILDADGRPLFTALEFVQAQIAKIQTQINQIGRDSYKNVEDVGKVIQSQTQSLREALSQIRTLTAQTPSQQINSQSAKTFYQNEARERQAAHTQAQRAINQEEIEGQRIVAESNARTTAREIESTKLLRAAKLEAARAGITEDARTISNLNLMAQARADNIDKLRRYREASRQVNDPEQQRALATLIDLEKARGKALETTNNQLVRQRGLADQRLSGQNRSLATYDVQNEVSAYGSQAAQARFIKEQADAQRALAGAVGPQQIQEAQRLLDIANARVTAVNRIVNAEEKVAAAEQRTATRDLTSQHRARLALASEYASVEIASVGPENALSSAMVRQVQAKEALIVATVENRDAAIRELAVQEKILLEINKQIAAEARANATRTGAGPSGGGGGNSAVSNILSPGYAAAAFARTSVYGAAAMAAYGAFNTIQNGLQNLVQMEDELGRLQAISNSTSIQMVTLKASIFAVAEASRFSVVDLIKISQTLAQAGVTASQMEGVLRSVAQLATASGSSPDEAVQLVTASLGAFNLQASEAGRVADLMTSALNRTRLTVQQAGQAIQYVGVTAAEQNISLETLLATIGAVAQGGIRSGSTLGTGYRQLLVALQEPTEKLTRQLTLLHLTQEDVDISTRGEAAVLDTLRNAGFGAAQAYAGLNVRAAAFYLTAAANVDVIDQLQLSFANSGAAATANDRAMNTLAAQWQRFKNIISEEFAEKLQSALNSFQSTLTQINDYIEQTHGIINAVSQMGVIPQANVGANVIGPTIGSTAGLVNQINPATQLGNAYSVLSATLGVLHGHYDALFSATERFTGIQIESAASAEAAATANAEASQRVDDQRSKIVELNTEMQRLIVQRGTLRDNDVRSAAETATLTSRFSGLANMLVITGNRYDDLVNAMHRYTQEQNRILGIDLTAQVASARVAAQVAAQGGGQAIAAIESNPAFMSRLSPQQISAMQILQHPSTAQRGVNGPEFSRAVGIMGGAVEQFSHDLPELSRLINQLVQATGTISQTGSTVRNSTPLINNANFLATGPGADTSSHLTTISSLISNMQSMANGTPEKTHAAATANAEINSVESALRGRIRAGSLIAFTGAMQDVLRQLPAMRQQIQALLAQTPEEARAARAAAAAARRADHAASQMPLVNMAQVDTIVERALGSSFQHMGSANVRSAESEDALHRAGRTAATGTTSDHVPGVGLAHDYILPRGTSQTEGELLRETVDAALRNQGIVAHVIFETGRGHNQGTAAQIHVGVHHGTRVTRTADPQQAADTEQASLESSQLSLDQHDLTEKLKALGRTTTQETLNAAIDAAHTALTTTTAQMMVVARRELAAAGIFEHTAQYDARIAQVTESVTQLNDEFQTKVSQGIIQNVDRQLTAAQRAFDRAIAPSRDAQAVADATVQGFSIASVDGTAPSYVLELAQRRAQQAAEAAQRVRLTALTPQINSDESTLRDLTAQRDSGTLDATHLADITAKVETLTASITDLHRTRDALAATLSAGGLIPHSIGEGLSQAAEAYRLINHTTETFSQTIVKNLGGALDQVTTSLTDMFSSMIDGSQTALGAFANFAKSIMSYIAQMIAKFIALKIVTALLNIISGSTSSGVESAGSAVQGAFHPTFNGGQVAENWFTPRVRPYAGGGEVNNGSTAQDSVRAILARGEWVVRKAAVDSVGNGFMANLNSHGSKAIDSLAKMPQISVSPKTDLKVYMVKPDVQPPLGKNDILLTWQEDVLSGGESMKLIRHISREG